MAEAISEIESIDRGQWDVSQICGQLEVLVR